MARIHRMDEHLTNMIAAGEVVERPMGIVKECVENSIDAKANRIEVWITQGGIEQIEIYDNGIGMDKEDIELAFERHATSKIKAVEDLWTISTLGFRGEALPSIASVSHVEMRSNNGHDSNRIILDYGQKQELEPFGCNPGTEIVIRGLFQKTPARLKHLRSSQYEAALVSDVVQKFAMSHPEIAFRLVVDGKESFKTSGSNQLQEVLYHIYGKEVAKNSFELNGEDFDTRITGLGVLPSISRANRNYITLFINQRMIRSFKLQKAIVDAYHKYMPEDRYPIVIMHIELDEQLIDVNVHPSKWEIRLSKEQQLVLLVQETMEKCLALSMQAPAIEKVKSEAIRVEQPAFFEEVPTKYGAPIKKVDISIAEKKEEYQGYGQTSIQYPNGIKKEENETNRFKPAQKMSEEMIQKLYPKEAIEDEAQKEIQEIIQENKKRYEMKQEEVKVGKKFPELEVLAQLHGRYILASSDEGLVIIDQHAAEERSNYEKFQRIFAERQSAKIDLLVPISLEGSNSILLQLDSLNGLVKELDLEFEAFSENTLLVRSIPLWMQQLDEVAFLQDVLDGFVSEGNLAKAHLNKDVIATKACHHSIRFNRNLTKEEMIQVIQDLENCEQPFHCPHGRPTMITISEAQLIREFQR